MGDTTAITSHRGHVSSQNIVGALLVLAGIGHRVALLPSQRAIAASHASTRPPGASYDDGRGVTRVRGELDVGPGNIALDFSLALVVGIAALARVAG
ncbi:MAG: hypothetical protein HIU57_08580, partial [Acidobacteria bacterium]|nr:hypothetical protein [Acidobacteriota bacterium]